MLRKEDGVVRSGETVIARNIDKKDVNVVKVSGEQKIGKSRMSLKDLIGEEYGRVFEIMGRKLKKIEYIEGSYETDMILDEYRDSLPVPSLATSLATGESYEIETGPDHQVKGSPALMSVATCVSVNSSLVPAAAFSTSSGSAADQALGAGSSSNLLVDAKKRTFSELSSHENETMGTDVAQGTEGVATCIGSRVPGISGSSGSGGSGSGSGSDAVIVAKGGVKTFRGDNSNYVDTNTAQKLTDVDIEELKESGMTGEEIIKMLMRNSETFSVKNDFTQAKWIKRKEKKYIKKIRILKSTPATLCEAAFAKNGEKICHIRYDVLAQILSQSGVHGGGNCRALLIDSTVGMVTGSVAYKMRGNGRILTIFGGQQPHMDMLHSLNLDERSLSIIDTISSVQLGPAAKDVARHGFSAPYAPPIPVTPCPSSSDIGSGDKHPNGVETHHQLELKEEKEQEQQREQGLLDSARSLGHHEDGCGVAGNAITGEGKGRKDTKSQQNKRRVGKEERDTDKSGSRSVSKSETPSTALTAAGGTAAGTAAGMASRSFNATYRSKDEQARVHSYLREGVDSLIITTRFRPLPLLKQALFLLSPSSPFVVFHEFMEPLLECYHYLQQTPYMGGSSSSSSTTVQDGSSDGGCGKGGKGKGKKGAAGGAQNLPLALRLVLCDTWSRDFQTLPGRMRPEMLTSTSGGYLLYGIYVGMVPCDYRSVITCGAAHD